MIFIWGLGPTQAGFSRLGSSYLWAHFRSAVPRQDTPDGPLVSTERGTGSGTMWVMAPEDDHERCDETCAESGCVLA